MKFIFLIAFISLLPGCTTVYCDWLGKCNRELSEYYAAQQGSEGKLLLNPYVVMFEPYYVDKD